MKSVQFECRLHLPNTPNAEFISLLFNALTVMCWNGHFVKYGQNIIKCSIQHYITVVAHILCSIQHYITAVAHTLCSIQHYITAVAHTLCSIQHYITAVAHTLCFNDKNVRRCLQ